MYCYYNVLPKAFCCLLVNNIVYIKKIQGTYLHEYLFHAKFNFGGVTVFAIHLFNKIKRKEKKKEKEKEKKKTTTNLKKHVSLYFTDVMSKYIYF